MPSSIRLKQENLAQISERIASPAYERKQLATGMVHIGVGGFHRAHQAYFTHSLLQETGTSDWGICGIGLREGDRKLHDILQEQDGLYTLIVRHPNGENESQVIGSIVDFLLGFDNPGPVIDRMADPRTKIVSLTITEGGYNFNSATGEFDFSNPDIIHELNNPHDPRTVYGFLAAALQKRRTADIPPFTIMSCDNIQHNGDMIRDMLLTFTHKLDESLSEWIAAEVSFPNSMVDRITPVTSQAEIKFLRETYGIEDEWPVTCEPFLQWIMEDNFSNGRPAFEKVGVQFVADVKPYEKMKLRLLNAGHSVLGILGALYGYKTINECVEDEVFANYLRAFLDEEVSPVLDEVPGIDLKDYKASLLTRFANPNVRDTVTRICSESSAKLPKFLISTLKDNLDRQGSIKFATLVIAAWCYYSDKAIDRNRKPLEVIDALSEELHRAASHTPDDPLSFIRQEAIFGNLVQRERFTETYTRMIRDIYSGADLRQYMQGML